MKGNFHVQFLGEGVAATSPPYPTPGWVTTQVYPARCPDLVSPELLGPSSTESETSPLFEHGLGAGIIAAILSAREGDAVSCFRGESALGRVRFGEELRGGGLPCESSEPARNRRQDLHAKT